MGKKPNHFLVEYSELMHEWDYEKNNALGQIHLAWVHVLTQRHGGDVPTAILGMP